MADNEKFSSIQAFNEAFPSTPFKALIDGHIDMSTLGAEQTEALGRMFTLHPGRYMDFMAQAQENFERRQSQTSADLSKEADPFTANQQRKMQNVNALKNMNILQDFMDSYQTPALSNQVNINHGHLLTPFAVGKNGSPMYSEAAKNQRLVSYYASARNPERKSSPVINPGIVDDVMNGNMLSALDDGSIAFQGGTIWSQLDAPAATPAYSTGFSVNAQSYLEKFREFNAMTSNPAGKNNGFISLDIETFGDLPTKDWFHINEIAANKFEYIRPADNLKGSYQSTGQYSWLAKTPNALANDMSLTIHQLQQNPLDFSKLTEAKKRSLVDLMRYSTSGTALGEGININPASFTASGDNMNVVHSNAIDVNGLYTGKKLNERALVENFGAYSEHMYSGLNNLREHGSEDVIAKYNNLVESNKNLYFITHNGDAFDIKGLQAAGGNAPARHLDWLKLEQSVYPTGFAMQQAFGRPDGVRYEEGPWTLQEHRRTYGWDTNMGHIGSYDVGEFGTAGIVLQSKDTIAEKIKQGNVEDPDRTGLRRKTSELSYNQTPLRQGETLFATSAVQNYSGNALDFQAEFVDGQMQRINPAFNRNVLDAESSYTVNGIRQLPGEERYALELINQATDSYSYIIREGATARADIAQFVQQHLTVADEMIAEGVPGMTAEAKALIQDERMTDLARRRYEDIFGLRQGTTKGFSAAQRMFNNVKIFNENVSSPEGPLSVEELTSKMDFNSLQNGAFNSSEANAFWKMLPRLRSEAGAYGVAIERIQENIPIDDSLEGWKKRDLNLQRSLALKRFSTELDYQTGGAPVRERAALPYERHILSFNDRASGQQRTLNLRDTTTAYQGIQSYVYADSKKYAGNIEAQKQIANDRYLTLLTSLQDDGYMSKAEMDTFMNDFLDMEDPSPAAHSKVLAMELPNNLAILNRIEAERKNVIVSTDIGRRELIETLDTTLVENLADNAVVFAKDVAGDRMTREGTVRPLLTPAMNELFDRIDQTNPITRLEPNNRMAVEGLMERFMSMGKASHNMGFALTASNDNNQAYLNVFEERNTASILSHLESGDPSIHPQAVRIPIPLIGENGTMRMEDVQVNARSSVIRGEGGIQKISSVQELTDMFTPGSVKKILTDIQSGNIEDAQTHATRTARAGIQHLAGIAKDSNGGVNDTFYVQNNLSDLYKQSYVDVSPAMIAEYLDEGLLTKDDVLESGRNYAGDLRPTIHATDLTISGIELIDRTKLDWMERNGSSLNFEADLSAVKSNHAPGMVSALSARQMTPFGIATRHTRDNSAQLANAYPFNEKLQRSFAEITDNTYTNFNEPTVSPYMQELEKQLPDGQKQSVVVKLALMSDDEVASRLDQMMDPLNPTHAADMALLRKEKIVNADGTLNPARVPTVHEQQIIVNKAIHDRLIMENEKFFSLDEKPKVIQDFVDEHNGRQFLKDGKIGIRYEEQAHKVYFDFEKGTFGGGGGYSLGFLERFTGVEGVGAIIGPDIAKHDDISSYYRGYLNRVADSIQEMSGKDRVNAIQRVESEFLNSDTGAYGVRVQDDGTSIRIEEDLRGAGIREIDNRSFVQMMDDVGVGQFVDSDFGPTPVLHQAMTIARVSNYARNAGDEGGKVSYGPRELDVLRRQGANKTATYIENLIDQINSTPDVPGKMSARQQAESLMEAGRAIAGRVEPGPNEQIRKSTYFRPSPLGDGNRATYARTIIDSDWVREQNPEGSKGTWVSLPEVAAGEEFLMEGKAVNKVFLPYVQVEGKDNEVWKGDMNRLNENIIKRAQALENSPLVDEKGNAFNSKDLRQALQNDLEALNQRIRYDLTSSKGFIGSSVLKARMPNSTAGLTKIIPPWMTEKLGNEALTIISEADAREMGIFDRLSSGDDFYSPVLRNPTFHEKAIRITRLQMSDQLPKGHQLISANIAEDLRADTDGDMNNALAVLDDDVQAELREVYTQQQRERALAGNVAGSDYTYDLEKVGNVPDRPGVSSLYDPKNQVVAYDEFAGKFGKQLVGMASNLNYEYSHLVRQYGQAAFGDSDQAIRDIDTFFSGRYGVEQKIISTKNPEGSIIDATQRNPALTLIESIQRRDWVGALEVDQNMLGSQFSNEKGRMPEAIARIQTLQAKVPEEDLRHASRRIGLRSGVPDSINVDRQTVPVTMEDIMDVIDGNDESRLASNQTVAGLNRIANAPQATAPLELVDVPDQQPVTPAPHAYVPSQERIEQVIPTYQHASQYEERGLAKLGSMLEGVRHSRMGVGLGIGAGIGAAVLMVSNLTSAETATPESRPHNNEQIQDAHSGGNGAGLGRGTARVEQNGTGLNGMQVNVSGTVPGHISNDQIGGLANQALSSSGIQGNINIRSQDDESSIDQAWLQQKFKELLLNGSVGG